MKRILMLFLVCLLLLTINPLVSASQISGNQQDMSITVNYFSASDVPVMGAPLKLYKIASMDYAYRITVDPRFAEFKEEIEGEDTHWDVLAFTLSQYIMEKNIPCDDEDTVDASGQVHFPTDDQKLSRGVYLVCGPRYRLQGKIYTPSPIIVSLPNFDQEGKLVYHIISKIKFSYIEDLPIDITVIKRWQDLGYKEFRPTEIKVKLYKNGWPVSGQEVILNEANNWSYTWYDLDPLHYWSVSEECPDHYDVTYRRGEKDEKLVCIIINKYNPDDDEPDETEPGNTEPGNTEPGNTEPGNTEPGNTEPGNTEPGNTEPGNTEPNKPKPDKPKPEKPEKLPQTGVLTWPIPWMTLSGMVLFLIGWLLYKDSGKEEYEE